MVACNADDQFTLFDIVISGREKCQVQLVNARYVVNVRCMVNNRNVEFHKLNKVCVETPLLFIYSVENQYYFRWKEFADTVLYLTISKKWISFYSFFKIFHSIRLKIFPPEHSHHSKLKRNLVVCFDALWLRCKRAHIQRTNVK